MAEPTHTIEAAFTTDPLTADGSVVWEDLSDRLRGFTTSRELDEESGAGTGGSATIRFENRDGELTPSNTSGTWYPLLPNRRVRITSHHSGVDRVEFNGFIDRYVQERDGPDDVTCVLECSDGTKVLNLERTPSLSDYPEEVERVMEPVWGYWRMNEGPSTRVKPGGWVKKKDNKDRDKKPQRRWRKAKRQRFLASASGTEAQVQGNPSFLQSSGDGPIAGEVTYGIRFAGIQSQRLRIPVLEADDRPGAENKLALSVVVQPAALSGVMVKGPFVTALSGSGYTLSLSAGTVTFQVAPNDGLGIRSVGTGSVFAVGDWVHIVASWRGADGNMQIYVNGALEAETFADPGTLLRGDTAAPIYVAADPNLAGGTAFFNGIMAELVISEQDLNRDGLAAANVEQLYRASVGGFGSPAHLSAPGIRIGEIIAGISAIDMPESYFSVLGLFDLEQGEIQLLPQRVDEPRLDMMRRVTETDGGLLFVAKDGTLTFRDNSWLLAGAGGTSAGTFTNILPTSLPYTTDLQPSTADDVLYPVVSVTREDGNTQTVGDTSEFWGAELALESTLHVTDGAALNHASILHSRYGRARNRVDRITLNGMMSASLYPHILGRELGDRVTVVHRYPDGNTETTDCRIIGITRNTVNLRHTATWELAPAYMPEAGDAWSLGVAGFTDLGTTTTLG